ncbi:MAG: ribosome-associated translation inhibitor RaiA [Anaerolineae bacterium]
MEVKIRGRNVEITPRLESYIDRKVDRLDRYLPGITEVRVDLAEERSKMMVAQITVRHSRGTILRAEERTNDLLASVDSVVDKIYRQIEKFKGKRRRRGESQEMLAASETAVEIPEDELESGAIVRRKQFSVAPLSDEEAIEQMELLGHDFFVFVNARSGDINVLYRRRDGDYGLLEPEV